MEIKGSFVTREIMGETVVVPVGDNAEKFRGMIRLNSSGAVIWKGIGSGMNEEEIARELVKTYSEVDYEKALTDTKRIIRRLADEGIVAL